jgi:DNA topoisomerase VI subunit B
MIRSDAVEVQSKLERITSTQSRDREYFDANELRTMTGQPRERFADVVVKELGDNALDAAEMRADERKGVPPKVIIQVWRRKKDVVIRVSDNAGGISPKKVEKILDMKTRTSDKAAYRSTTRGLQGNALKTIIGMPYALGSKKPVIIDTQGKRFVIRPRVDPAGVAHIDCPYRDAEDQGGTTWTVSLPLSDCGKTDFAKWARDFALYNPHAIVKFREISAPSSHAQSAARKPAGICNPGGGVQNSADSGASAPAASHAQSRAQKRTRIYNPLVRFPSDEWKKFLPTDLIPIQWYDEKSFAQLVFSYIHDGNQGGKKYTLRKFVILFPGFSARDRSQHVTDQFPDIDTLDDFEHREDRVNDLLKAMQSAPGMRPPGADALGFVGKQNFLRRFEQWYGVKQTGEGKPRFWYESTALEVGGIPYVFEVALAQTKRPGRLHHGVNFSPTFEDPLTGTTLRHAIWKKKRGQEKSEFVFELWHYGARGFLEGCHAIRPETSYDKLPFHSAAAVHLVCPAPQFMEKSKTRIELPKEVATAVAETLYEACKTFYQEGERRKKDAARQAKRDEERERAKEDKEMTLTRAVSLVLPEGIRTATGDYAYKEVSNHTLYYHVRPLVQKHTKKPLTAKYFEGTLLPAYKLRHPECRPYLYAEARGTLYEPHTGVAVELGTREVRDYTFPKWRYRKILFIEKQGLWPIFKKARIAERFDMAIIAGEGFASEACRVLFQHAQKGEYLLFVLHDADPYGYDIARTLAEETARMPGYKVNVTDLGLFLQDALDRGLPAEQFLRKKAISQALVLNELEKQYFVGVPKSPFSKHFIARRVELNAFTAPALVEYTIAGLTKHGATGKLIPPDDKLPGLAQDIYDAEARAKVKGIFNDILSDDEIADALEEDLRALVSLDGVEEWIRKAFEKDQGLSWDEALKRALGKKLRDKKKQMSAMVMKKFKEAIGELDLD